MAKPVRYTREMYEEYRKKGYWDSTTPSDIWIRNAELYPEEEAIADSRLRLTWKEANLWIDRVALGFLELGIKKDQMIVLQLPNSVELSLLRVACERAGLLCLPVLRTWRHREMAYALEHVEAVGLVIPWRFRGFDYFKMVQGIRSTLPKLKHIFVVGDKVPEGAISLKGMIENPLEQKYPKGYLEKFKCKAEEFSLVLPTSGSTGFPKFVENPICSFMCRERACVEDLRMTKEDVLVCLAATGGGSNGRVYLAAPLAGAKVVMLEHFSPEQALQLIERERVTIAPMVPAQATMIVRHPDFDKYDISSLRILMSMGAPLPYEVALEMEEKLGCVILQNYSSIDCSAACMGRIDDPPEIRLKTVGRPYAGAEIRIVDEEGVDVAQGEVGEILLRGPGAVSGYYRDPEAMRQAWTPDGWFKMGDLGRLDEGGNLVIVGRKKEVIIRGGQNIYPVEIEDLLLGHKDVSNVAIVKMPDPVMGERACAYVVLKPGRKLAFDEMISFLKEKGIASYKLPERMEIVEGLPMVGGGQKVDKKRLERDIAGKVAGEGKISSFRLASED